MNVQLKLKIIEKFGTATKLCREINYSEDRISKIIHKRIKPTDKDKEVIARALKENVANIFP